jgi:glycerol-3-phosphate dehydrogenase (NAD(P)+)
VFSMNRFHLQLGLDVMDMSKIAIIGAGSWGSALSVLLAKNNHEVTVWSCFADEVKMLNEGHEQKDKLPGVKIPESVLFTVDIGEAVKDKEFVVFVVPSQTVRSCALSLKPFVSKDMILVCCSKGLEESSGMRLSEVISSELCENTIVGLYGPSHAEEVAIGIPTTVVAACSDRIAAERVQDAFMSKAFRVYTSSDLIGAEVGSALKNIIALCAGISDGLGYGDNTKAALMTRGMTEIARLGIALGANAKTFSGLTGIGDLIVTCTSHHSRNWNAGNLIGKGATLEEATKAVKMVVEGVSATKAVHGLSAQYGISMPISEEAYRILFEGKECRTAVHDLMTRSKKHESEESGW